MALLVVSTLRFFALALIVTVTTCSPADRSQTNEARQILRESLALEDARMHWSFWLLPPLKRDIERNQTFDGMYDPRYQHLSGNTDCQLWHETEMPICSKSYVLEHDRNRVPENLVHVRCTCQSRCAQSMPYCYYCQPVYIYTQVYRRRGDQFVHTWEAIPIACEATVNVRRVVG